MLRLMMAQGYPPQWAEAQRRMATLAQVVLREAYVRVARLPPQFGCATIIDQSLLSY